MAGPRLRLAQIKHRRAEPFDGVIGQFNVARAFADLHAHAIRRPARFADLVGDEFNVLDFALNIDGDRIVAAGVDDAVVLERVAVRRIVVAAFGTEQDADFG